jgi:hypothetical protein
MQAVGDVPSTSGGIALTRIFDVLVAPKQAAAAERQRLLGNHGEDAQADALVEVIRPRWTIPEDGWTA